MQLGQQVGGALDNAEVGGQRREGERSDVRLGIADGCQKRALASVGPPDLLHRVTRHALAVDRSAHGLPPPLTRPTSAISRSSSSYMHSA